MNDVEIKQDLSDVISSLSSLENDRLLLWATIYTRKCEELKKKKITDFKKYFDTNLKFYKRDLAKYSKQYIELEEKYEKLISSLINQYMVQYQYIQNEEVVANSNQKIAIANFIVSKRGEEKARLENNSALIEKSERKIFATAQKKLNYDVIIDECNSRLQKCMNDTYVKIDEIFDISDNKLTTYRNSLFNSLKHFFRVTFTGDSCFNKYVLENLKIKLGNIESHTISAVSDVKLEMMLFISQMEKVRIDVNSSFNETLNKGIHK